MEHLTCGAVVPPVTPGFGEILIWFVELLSIQSHLLLIQHCRLILEWHRPIYRGSRAVGILVWVFCGVCLDIGATVSCFGITEARHIGQGGSGGRSFTLQLQLACLFPLSPAYILSCVSILVPVLGKAGTAT
jgi:hypothetical protein